jgi:phosphoserine phosphatase
MMTPPRAEAICNARADLPLAVGPAISSADFWVRWLGMDSVLVLMAAPGSGAITPEVVTALRDHGGGAPHWLAQGEACEVDAFARWPEFRLELRNRPIDAAIVSIHNRRKRLLLADMDSTMIHQECIDELGVVAGVGDRIKAITAQAMRGELDFDGALRERVALLKGLPVSVIDNLLRTRITFMEGGKTLLATMRANGAYAALVSGGFLSFTGPVAAQLGFDENRANTLLEHGGKLTGEVSNPILGQQAKLDSLRAIATARNLSPADAIAVGDGANDLAMLSEAGLGVALHAKPHVQDSSLIRINHADLTSLLYLQGYRREQFVLG